jgi:hypothetical protein
MTTRPTIGDATVDEIQSGTHQPEPVSGVPQCAIDGREYWRRRALRAEIALLELSERLARLTASTPPVLGPT